MRSLARLRGLVDNYTFYYIKNAMKNIHVFLLCFFLFLLCSCGGGGGEYNSFSYDLQGTWKAIKKTPIEDPNAPYEFAQIEIGFKTIKITGGNITHFQNIPPNVEWEGYSNSEENLIYIKARDEWQSPVAYKISNVSKKPILTLRGGGLDEDFERIN